MAQVGVLFPSWFLVERYNSVRGGGTIALRSKSDETTAREGKWITDEDSTLKDTVEKHNGEY
jgi:hypothetical protein